MKISAFKRPHGHHGHHHRHNTTYKPPFMRNRRVSDFIKYSMIITRKWFSMREIIQNNVISRARLFY